MSNSKLEQLDKELSSLNSSKQKLDYWKENFYDRFMKESNLMDLLGNIIEYKPIYEEDDIIADKVFYYFECGTVHTSAKIPAEIHLKHFPDFERDVEYTNWFLIFNAKKWARGYYISKFQSKLGYEITDELIEAELNELKGFEDKATAALLAKEIKIEDAYPKPGLKSFQELKRLQSGFYKDKVVSSFNILGGNSVVDIYSKYLLYKNWLNIKYDKLLSEKKNLTLAQLRGNAIILEAIEAHMNKVNSRFDEVDKMLFKILSKQDFIASMLLNLEHDRISIAEQQKVLDILQSGINELLNKLSEQEVHELKAKNDKANLEPDLKGKLKMTIPLIPFLITYENELSWDWKKISEGLRGLLM